MTDHDFTENAVIVRNTEDITKIFDLCEKIRNRLPNWATLLISLMGASIGWLLAVMKLGV